MGSSLRGRPGRLVLGTIAGGAVGCVGGGHAQVKPQAGCRVVAKTLGEVACLQPKGAF